MVKTKVSISLSHFFANVWRIETLNHEDTVPFGKN